MAWKFPGSPVPGLRAGGGSLPRGRSAIAGSHWWGHPSRTAASTTVGIDKARYSVVRTYLWTFFSVPLSVQILINPRQPPQQRHQLHRHLSLCHKYRLPRPAAAPWSVTRKTSTPRISEAAATRARLANPAIATAAAAPRRPPPPPPPTNAPTSRPPAGTSATATRNAAPERSS